MNARCGDAPGDSSRPAVSAMAASTGNTASGWCDSNLSHHLAR